jgi:Zn-dependent protease with chaperone function
MTVAARYYDGRRSVPHDVIVSTEGGDLRLVGPEVDLRYPLEQVQVQPPLANTPRLLVLPRGDTCLIPDSPACDRLLGSALHARRGIEDWVDRLERKGSYAISAVVVSAAVMCALIWFVIPGVADVMAQRLSPSLDASFGRQALDALDRMALSPSELMPSRQAELTQRFDALVTAAGLGMKPQLVFRRSADLGPNAFALPGGTIVVLDALVEAAGSSDEVVAVMCHEIGHVRGRHSLRQALQNSAAAVVLGFVLGDVTSVGTFASALPNLLLSNSYSREFEREADTYGVALMERAGVPLDSFSSILLRLEAHDGAGQYPSFLASHPSTAARVQAIGQRRR